MLEIFSPVFLPGNSLAVCLDGSDRPNCCCAGAPGTVGAPAFSSMPRLPGRAKINLLSRLFDAANRILSGARKTLLSYPPDNANYNVIIRSLCLDRFTFMFGLSRSKDRNCVKCDGRLNG